MSEKDRGNLESIVDSCSKIETFVQDTWDADAFFADEKTFDAVLMNFIVISEAVARLPEELREQAAHIPWPKIKGLRNIVAHNYFGVDAEEVWQIIKDYLPELKAAIQQLLVR